VVVKITFRYSNVFFYNHLYQPEFFYEKRYNQTPALGYGSKARVSTGLLKARKQKSDFRIENRGLDQRIEQSIADVIYSILAVT
jgi:hypothetical protein